MDAGRTPPDTSGAVPLFCDSALAERIERAEAGLLAKAVRAAGRRTGDGASFVTSLAGGTATFADAASPFNKIAGLGFRGVPDEDALDAVEQAYADRGAPVQAEVAHLADPAVSALLMDRGYRLETYENVLGRALTGADERIGFPGIDIRISDDADFDVWMDTVIDGVVHPDAEGLPGSDDFPRQVYEDAERDFDAAGVTRYGAWCEGVLAGGASLHLAEGVAQMAGAATAPAYRRRGVQAALLSARLADAVAAGCDIAVVTTQPGSTSHHNVQRRGFQLLYTRAVLVKRT